MNSREHSWQFLCAGGLCAGLLAAITVLAFRDAPPRDAATVACLVDIALQLAFGASSLWLVHASGLANRAQPFVDHGSPSLTSLAKIAPWLVVLQIAMGAALRYKLMGAISHVAGAMLVGAFLLYLATGVMAPSPNGHPAKIASISLLWVVLTQVMLGIAAYVVRFGQGSDSTLPDTRAFSIGHIITGALTLSATCVTAYLIQKSSTRQEASGQPSTRTA